MPDTAKIQGIEFSIKGGVSKTSTEAVERLSRALKDLRAVTGRGLKTGELARQINDFAAAMKALKDASKIKISDNLGNNISTLAGAMKGINSGQISLLKQMGTAMQAFNKTGKISIQEGFEQRIVKIADAAGGLSDTAIAKLSQMASALSKLQGVKLTGFSGAVNKAKKEGDKAKRDAEKAKKEADKNAKESAKQQAKQQTATGQIGEKQKEERKTSPFGKLMLERGESLSKLDLMRAKLAELRVDFAKNIQLGKLDDKGVISAVEKIQNLKKQIEDMQNASNIGAQLKSMFQMPETSSFNHKWGWDLKQNLSAVGMLLSSHVHPAVKLVASVLGAVGKEVWNIAKGIAKWAFHTAVDALKKMWKMLQRIPNAIAKVVGTVGKAFAAAGKNLASFAWKHSPVNKLTDSFEHLKTVLSSFTRIAFYRIIRSAIKFVTDALEEGSNNAYFFSKKFGDVTKYISENMDILSTATFKMRNQVGAAWATLIATVEPLLLRLLELVTRAAQVVTQFFGAMGGKSSYLRAKSFPKMWAEDAEEATDKAKEWKNQLMGFDELNVLSDNPDSSGGKSLNVPDYGELFEEVPIESWIENLKDMDPYEIGLTIAGGLNDLTKKIDDWFLGIRPKLKKYAKDFSDLLNGLIDGTDWALLGKTVGDGLNTVFGAIDTFLTNTRWKDLGRGVGTAIKSLFDTVDWDLVGRTFAHGWNALLYIIEGVVTTPGIWESMGRSIGKFVHAWFSEIDIDSLASSLIAIINGTAKAIENFLAQDPFANVARKLTNAIHRLITEVQWDYVGEQFGRLFQEVLNQINTVIFGTDWKAFGDSLGRMISNFLANIDFNMLGRTLVGVFTSVMDILYGAITSPGFMANLATSLSDFVLGGLNQLADWLGSLDSTKITRAFKDFFGNIKSEEIKDAFVRVVKSAWTLAMSTLDEIWPQSEREKFMNRMKDALTKAVSKAIDLMFTALEGMHNVINYRLGKLLFPDWFNDWYWSRGEYVGKEIVMGMIEGAKQKESGLNDQFRNTGKNSGKAMEDGMRTSVMGINVNGIVGYLKGPIKEAGKSVSSAYETVGKNSGLGFKNAFSRTMTEAKQTIRGKLDEIRKLFNVTWKFPKIKMPHFSWTWQSVGKYVQIPRISVSWYKNGGFLEDGLFTMNHGEIAGKFSNGQSVVANNKQITEGIAEGIAESVYGAFVRAFSETIGNSSGGGNGSSGQNVVVLQVNGREFARAIYNDQKAVAREKGISMIANFA